MLEKEIMGIAERDVNVTEHLKMKGTHYFLKYTMLEMNFGVWYFRRFGNIKGGYFLLGILLCFSLLLSRKYFSFYMFSLSLSLSLFSGFFSHSRIFTHEKQSGVLFLGNWTL